MTIPPDITFSDANAQAIDTQLDSFIEAIKSYSVLRGLFLAHPHPPDYAVEVEVIPPIVMGPP